MGRTATDKKYLHEIQGLRFVAALMVAVYHIWFHRVSGGVDIFFVVAAFFIATSFDKFHDLKFTDVFNYIVKTLGRILPGATVVIVSTIFLGIAFLPSTIWGDELKHAIASTLFLENWLLARSGADYLQQGFTASPFQQFWALSLQMQLYFLIPLVFFVAAKVSKLIGVSRISAWTFCLGVIFIASFVYSVIITRLNQPWAYFDTGARIWEFCAGALLGLHYRKIKLSGGLAKALGYAGLVVIILMAAIIDVSRLFPGAVALIPVLAATAIIVSAQNDGNIGILKHRFLVQLGDISFSFYLWHWPLLITYRFLFETESVTIPAGLVIIFASGILAWLTTVAAERPLRKFVNAIRGFVLPVVACASILLPAVIGIGTWYYVYRVEVRDGQRMLAQFMTGEATPAEGSIIPAPVIARLDLPVAYNDGCHQNITNSKVIECTYGDVNASRTLVLVGGSHSLQWLPVLNDLGLKLHFRIVNMTKSACFFSIDAQEFDIDPSCTAWAKQAVARIKELKPELVFTTATRGQGDREHIPQGYLNAWKSLGQENISVVALRDNPWMGMDVPTCVFLNSDDFNKCSVSRKLLLADHDPTTEINIDNVNFYDLSQQFCDAESCWAVKDSVLVYRDKHHITKTYVLKLMPEVEKILRRHIS
ncbi:acyltransferase [Rhizobiaceae bacterium BDR2-2]|uniref:Acyltransferase n=1 Tax=Ectorhizobium quercum TaxID=2965071 RepID=A0AAE3MWS3_9HYPH|nr:acyltransferase family protein [Ectorhizobium quercum]MCX8996403.1 acyltransferase [Ectorhizobium quercum]MCX8998558.1 acyltransferase [Ectorhizobium quercum]